MPRTPGQQNSVLLFSGCAHVDTVQRIRKQVVFILINSSMIIVIIIIITICFDQTGSSAELNPLVAGSASFFKIG